MAVGMAVAILIGLWVFDELSFNKNHENYGRIAQVMQNEIYNGETGTYSNLPMQLGHELRDNYGSHFKFVVRSSRTRNTILSGDEKALSVSGRFMEADALQLLSIKMVKGSGTGSDDLHAVLLSESVAKAFFDEDDPIGKSLRIDHKLSVTVQGIYEDLPASSTFNDLGFIAPWNLMVINEGLEKIMTWGNSWCHIFVQLEDNVPVHKASVAIKDAKLNNVVERDKKYKPEIFLHPMSDWHLFSEFKAGVNRGGRITFVRLFSVIGAFVLLLACINFMNFSTASSEKRAKEVGVRKVMGSIRSQLIGQFFCESFLVVGLAFILSLILAQLILPYFNGVADKELSVLWTNPLFWFSGFSFTLLVALISGSYPAFYLSAFRPIKVLKGTFRVGRYASIPRKALVVLQFTVTISLIIGTLIVYQQIQHVKSRPVGYDLSGLLTIPMRTREVHQHFEAFRNDLIDRGVVAEVSLSANTITNTWTTNSGFEWKGKDVDKPDGLITGGVSHEFGKTVGWKIKEGRDFSREFATDSTGFILNETAVNFMGFENPIGETIRAFGESYTVIGVVEDMVTQSLYNSVKPTIFHIDNFNWIRFINVKVNPMVPLSQALSEIGSTFKKHNPATPFEYKFADDEFAAKYVHEERIGKLAGFFAVIAIFISCLGLLGLTSFVAEQRRSEIGVRKVLGASVLNLWQMLTKDFLVLVLIACLIAIPVSWFFLKDWLGQYEYHVGVEWWVFLLAGSGALVIALLTVSYQALKAAFMNPVKSIKAE